MYSAWQDTIDTEGNKPVFYYMFARLFRAVVQNTNSFVSLWDVWYLLNHISYELSIYIVIIRGLYCIIQYYLLRLMFHNIYEILITNIMILITSQAFDNKESLTSSGRLRQQSMLMMNSNDNKATVLLVEKRGSFFIFFFRIPTLTHFIHISLSLTSFDTN